MNHYERVDHLTKNQNEKNNKSENSPNQKKKYEC